MWESTERALAGFARTQFGIVTRHQLFDAGVSRQQAGRLLRVRRLERLYESTYRIAGVPSSWHQSLLAASYAGGMRGGFGSHRSAAALWDLPGGEELIEVANPRWRRARHPGVIAHETKRYDAIDFT